MAHEILSLKLCELEDRLVNIPPKLNSRTCGQKVGLFFN